MSIFQNIYLQGQYNHTFWREANPLTCKVASKEIILSQPLAFSYGNAPVKSYDVKLTASYLHFTSDEGILIVAKIKWCLVKAFYDEVFDKSKRFGFLITDCDSEFEFFTLDVASLDLWITYLSGVTIMNNFEENYAVIKTIDSGEFGTVFLCEEVCTHSPFAVKKINKSLLLEKTSLNQVFNEITILKKLNHPLVIKLYTVFEDEDSVSLLTDYIPYGNLYQRIIKRKKFSEDEVMVLARNLYEVIAMLSKHRIIHRDIKLENILMTSDSCDFEFKLADFGLACFTDRYHKTCSGSPGYMAPEILRQKGYSVKADVFSAGVVIYILLAGGSPFKASTREQIIEKNMICNIRYDTKALHKVSFLAVGFLKVVLDPEPAERITADIALGNIWLNLLRKRSDTEAYR